MDQQPPIKTSKTLPVLIIVVVVLAIGVGAYFYFTQEEETSTNIDIAKNTNVVVNENVNSVANANIAANTNTAVDTSDWLTYENEEYGFSIRYPKTYTIEEQETYINILSDTVDDDSLVETFELKTTVAIQGNIKINLDDWIESSSIDIIKVEDFLMNGDIAREVWGSVVSEGATFEVHTIFYLVDNMGVRITAVPGNSDLINVFYAIAHSFDFIDPESTDTSDWLTYENEEWGFRIMYPSDWTKSTYGQMINLSPSNKEFLYEGGVAYPIYFTFKNESAQERLQNIEDNKKTVMEINSVDTVLVDGYFLTTYYIVDVSEKGGSLTINDHIEELQQAGNYDGDYASELSSVFKTMLSTFELL